MYQPTEINRNKLPSDEYKIEMSGGWEGSRETGLPSVSFPSGLVELNFNCIRGHKRAGTAPGSLRVPVCTLVFVNISSGAVHFFNCSHCYKAHDSKGRLTGQNGVT